MTNRLVGHQHIHPPGDPAHQPVICPDCGHPDGHADECAHNPWRRLAMVYQVEIDLVRECERLRDHQSRSAFPGIGGASSVPPFGIAEFSRLYDVGMEIASARANTDAIRRELGHLTGETT